MFRPPIVGWAIWAAKLHSKPEAIQATQTLLLLKGGSLFWSRKGTVDQSVCGRA